jgi:hypothetical protein
MTATIISTQGNYTFGAMTTQTISRLISVNTQMARLTDAIATASSGYTGTPGTEFELPTGNMVSPAAMAVGTNLFGVVPDPDEPGKNGTDYSYAVNSLNTAWAAFWAAAEAYIQQLDNGGNAM